MAAKRDPGGGVLGRAPKPEAAPCGPATSSALAKLEQISPQSMGATLAALEARGLIERTPDPVDGRRIVMSLTDAGLQVLRQRRSARAEQLARALSAGFTEAEVAQLVAAAPLLTHYGIRDYRRGTTKITAAIADAADAARLNLALGRPVLVVDSTDVDTDGTALVTKRSRFAAERIEFVVESG